MVSGTGLAALISTDSYFGHDALSLQIGLHFVTVLHTRPGFAKVTSVVPFLFPLGAL